MLEDFTIPAFSGHLGDALIVHRIEHEEIGVFELFLVPIGSDGKGLLFQDALSLLFLVDPVGDELPEEGLVADAFDGG